MTSPIVVALIAAIITIMLFYACGKIGNKYARGAAQIVTVILGVVISGALSADTSVAAMSGQYFFYIVVAYAILAKIFGR
jgi:hypothetical protein